MFCLFFFHFHVDKSDSLEYGIFGRDGIKGPARWAGPLWPIFFEGQSEKIKVRIELWPIGSARRGSRAIRA